MGLTATQKILLGRIITGLMGLICLFFVLALIGILLRDNPADDKTSQVISFSFTLGIFYFPLRFGIRLFKQGKSEAAPLAEPIEPGREIRVDTALTPAQYFQLSLLLTYTNLMIVYFTFLGLFMLFVQVWQGKYEFLPIQTSMGLLALILPVTVYSQSRKNYKTNYYLHEVLRYEFNQDRIITTGQTFTNTISWASLHKVKESKNWFLLYTSNLTMLPIPKADFVSPEDLQDFKQIILSTEGLRKDIK